MKLYAFGRVYAQSEGGKYQEKHELVTCLTDNAIGEKLGAGEKSYSVSFTLQDFSQMLSKQAIDQVMQKLIQQFGKQAGALIRK